MSLEDELADIVMRVGDIIIQTSSGDIGILIEKSRNYPSAYTPPHHDSDIYFWKVNWIKNVDRKKIKTPTMFLNSLLEEEGLRMAIFLGNVEHYKNNHPTGDEINV